MHKPVNDVVACVMDNGGAYLAQAVRLGQELKHVYYCNHSWVDSYPKLNKPAIGTGYNQIEVIENPWPVFNNIDFWIFPDCYQGPFQQWLAEQGEIVWGSRLGEELELDRGDFKKHMVEIGLPVNPYKIIKGFENLKNYLKEHEDVYVKISKWRGTVETFYSKNWTLIKPEVDEIEHHLEGLGDMLEYIVESAIPDAVEIGYDGWSIDGKYPAVSLAGVEIKDKAYCGRVMPYTSLSPLVSTVNEKLAPTLQQYGYRGFMSTEIRVKDNTPYLIDMTCRTPIPPGDIYLELIENLGEVMWAGANGEMVEPKYKAQYGVELLIESQWSEHHFQPVYYPTEAEPWVKLKKCMINGVHWIIPQLYESSDCGAIVGLGDTLEEAITNCKEVADTIEGNGLSIRQDAFDTAIEEFAKFETLNKKE
jgi:hypothetical protein